MIPVGTGVVVGYGVPIQDQWLRFPWVTFSIRTPHEIFPMTMLHEVLFSLKDSAVVFTKVQPVIGVGVGVIGGVVGVGVAQVPVIKDMFCQWVRFWFPARSTVVKFAIIVESVGSPVSVFEVVLFVWLYHVPLRSRPM